MYNYVNLYKQIMQCYLIKISLIIFVGEVCILTFILNNNNCITYFGGKFKFKKNIVKKLIGVKQNISEIFMLIFPYLGTKNILKV